MEEKNNTPFSCIYDSFLSKITDDMYMELDEKDTYKILKDLLLSGIQKFEFPRFDINNYTFQKETGEEGAIVEKGIFNCALTQEEINIIATYMIVEWIGQQLASVENARMKYSGSDFKFTSQANHMAKLQNMKSHYEQEGFHLQRLYKRRKADGNGIMRSTFGTIMETEVNN